MHSITILFCYRDREISRVKNALDSLSLQDNQHFQVLFVNYGSQDLFSGQVEALCANYTFCSYLYIDSQGKFWNRAEALNCGILKCDSQWIFTADVDLVFKHNFISQLYKESAADQAKFFSVGYLSDAHTKNLNINKLGTLPYDKSEDFALGMVLASKETLAKVNGYNSFYAIWGMEDNDIKARMDTLGIKTSFIHDVFMLHQYHAPANTREGGIPKGWIAYLKDYFSAGGEMIGLDKLVFPPKRPAKDHKQDAEFVTRPISGRILFIRHELLRAILNSPEKKLVLLIDTASHHTPKQSATLRFIRFTNAVFRFLGVEAYAGSNFEEQYASGQEIRNEVYFILKSLHTKLVDHYLEESEQHLKLVIVKF